MHELSIARAVVAVAERHASGRPVTAVRLRVGALRQVVPDTLAFYWPVAADGTLCAGSQLCQEHVAARLHCRACAHEWELAAPTFRCPSCAGSAVDVLCGEELDVESIEVEEAACTA